VKDRRHSTRQLQRDLCIQGTWLTTLHCSLLHISFTEPVQPTWNAISREGLCQYSLTCDTLGLYARSINDLNLLARVFRLSDDVPIPSTPFSLKGAKIAFCKTHVWPKAGAGTKNALAKAKELLEAKGANIQELELPADFEGITGWHSDILKGEGRASFLGRKFLGSY